MKGGVDFREIIKEGVPCVLKKMECGVCGFVGMYKLTLRGEFLGGCALCGWDPRRDGKYTDYYAWVEERNASCTQRKPARDENGELLAPVSRDDLDINPVYCMTRVKVRHVRRGRAKRTGLGVDL